MPLFKVHRTVAAGFADTTRGSWCAALVALTLLVIAAALPTFVVTALKGHGRVGPVSYDVDLNMGDGIFIQNACFGSSIPDEEFLHKLGLSCQGRRQTYKCGHPDKLSQKAKEKCHEFVGMQVLQGAAMLSVLLVVLTPIGCVTGRGMHLMHGVLLLVAAFSAVFVLTFINRSYMVTDSKLKCSTVLSNTTLCHRYGASTVLELIAIVVLFVSAIVEFVDFTRQKDEGPSSANEALLSA